MGAFYPSSLASSSTNDFNTQRVDTVPLYIDFLLVTKTSSTMDAIDKGK